MKKNEKYTSYEIMTNNLLLSKPYIDKNGNAWITLKVDNLIHPYGIITINKKYVNLQYNKNYSFITIFKDQEFLCKDKDGRIKGNVVLSKLNIYLQKMDELVQSKKAERKQITYENQQFLKNLNKNNEMEE